MFADTEKQDMRDALAVSWPILEILMRSAGPSFWTMLYPSASIKSVLHHSRLCVLGVGHGYRISYV